MKYTLKEIFEETEIRSETEKENLKIKKTSAIKSLRKKISVLVDNYTSSRSLSKLDQLDKNKNELEKVFENKIKTSSKEIFRYSQLLEKKNRKLESILFYQISANHSCKHTLPNQSVQIIADCISKVFGVALELDADQHQYVIIIIEKMLRLITENDKSDRIPTTIHSCRSLRIIAIFQGLMGIYKEEENTIKQALYDLESVFGSVSKASCFKIYSGCLFTLGNAYKNQFRLKESLEAYERALRADFLAEDYKDEVDRHQSIRLTEEILEEMKQKRMKMKTEDQMKLKMTN